MTEKELTVIELTEESIESMVYEIRGQKVMLDYDLARIYGYSTKAFNQQVKNNKEKFPEDFIFQLTGDEVKRILRSQNATTEKGMTESEQKLRSQIVTTRNDMIESEDSLWSQKSTLKNSVTELEDFERSKKTTPEKGMAESEQISRSKILTTMQVKGIKGGRVYLPYAFTEQGIYMLMTVLKGELAVKQSKALIRLFKRMKDYIVESNNLLTTRDILELSNQVNKNTRSIESLKRKDAAIDKKLAKVMDNFIDPSTYKNFLILNGQRIEADIAYQTIHSLAKSSIHIIDDYINVKTLHLLLSVDKNIQITIISDNVSRNPIQPEYIEDFKEETGINLIMKPSNSRCHDRFVLIDYGADNERIYLCGSSSKDAGKKATAITEFSKEYINHAFFDELIK